MKILNEPIKVMAIFNKDGKIEPVKFWFEDQAIMVEKILKIKPLVLTMLFLYVSIMDVIFTN